MVGMVMFKHSSLDLGKELLMPQDIMKQKITKFKMQVQIIIIEMIDNNHNITKIIKTKIIIEKSIPIINRMINLFLIMLNVSIIKYFIIIL